TSARTRDRSACPATPNHRAQSTDAQAQAPPVRPVSMDHARESLGKLEKLLDDLPARNTHRLATSWIQAVLAMEVQAPTWASWKGHGIDSTHPEDVDPQPDLGQPADPRRTG